MRQTTPRVVLASAGFAVYLIALAFIAFWPSPVDRPVDGRISEFIAWAHSIGMDAITYARIEWTANVVLFLPLGVFLTVLLGSRRWWMSVVIGILVSSLIELGQGIFLADRTASGWDVLANSTGTLIGALLTVATTATIIETRSRSRSRSGDLSARAGQPTPGGSTRRTATRR